MKTAHENYSNAVDAINRYKELFPKLPELAGSDIAKRTQNAGNAIYQIILDTTRDAIEDIKLTELLTEAFDHHLETLNQLRIAEAKETIKANEPAT